MLAGEKSDWAVFVLESVKTSTRQFHGARTRISVRMQRQSASYLKKRAFCGRIALSKFFSWADTTKGKEKKVDSFSSR